MTPTTIGSWFQAEKSSSNFLLPWVQEHHCLFIDTTTRELHCVYGLWICSLHFLKLRRFCLHYLNLWFAPCTLALWSSAYMLHAACNLPGIDALLRGSMWIALSLEHWSFGALVVCSLWTTTTGGCPHSHASKIALQPSCGLHCLVVWSFACRAL